MTDTVKLDPEQFDRIRGAILTAILRGLAIDATYSYQQAVRDAGEIIKRWDAHQDGAEVLRPEIVAKGGTEVWEDPDYAQPPSEIECRAERRE